MLTENLSLMFRRKNFSLEVDDPKILIKCRWRIKPFFYLVYRFLIALYTAFSFGVLIANSQKYFIYFTNWSYTLILINFIIKAVLAVKYYPFLQDDEMMVAIRSNILLKLSWIFTNVTTTSGILVTIVFWSLIAPNQPAIGHSDIHSHTLNIVIILLDFFMIAIPCNMSHVYQPMLYGISYCIFTVIYWYCGGVNNKGNQAIYGFSDWSKPVEVIKMFGFLQLGIICIYFVMYLVAKLRDFVWEHFNRRKGSSDVEVCCIQI